jgi:hypothetical protein
MRRFLLVWLPLLTALTLSTGTAQAVVVDLNPAQTGQVSVPFAVADWSSYYGVALIPGARSGLSTTASYLASAGVPSVASNDPCSDPAHQTETDLLWAGSWPTNSNDQLQPLCWHGGAVMHRNETFSLEWESVAPNSYWSGTKAYVQQYLKDVAASNGSLNSPYADTTQYWDGQKTERRAANTSLFGGGCDDNGTARCNFGSLNGSGPGHALPATSDCPPSGSNQFFQGPFGSITTAPNNLCVTDSAVRHEVTSLIDNDGLIAHTQPGYTPLVVVLTPPGVEVCLDSSGTMCSANGDAASVKAQFCSYHAEMFDAKSGHRVAYVVQPWTALTGCDEPDAPQIKLTDPPDKLAAEVGASLVSPLSQAQISGIVNPDLNGWFGETGLEIDDQNGCQPLGNHLDQVTLSSGTNNPYFIQREFNNASVLSNDPYTYQGCTPQVILAPSFVVPSKVDAHEVLGLDGSASASTLLIPNHDYRWSFGDGTTGVGPSVVHSYAKAGYYRVKLTVTDRGGNVRTLSQAIEVLTADGQPPSSHTGGGHHHSTQFKVHLQLLPQSLKDVLNRGLQVRVSSNEQADGFATLLIPQSAAKRAHIHGNRTSSGVVVGRGTVSGIKDGTVTMRVRVSSSTAKRLAPLKYLGLTLRMALVGKGGKHLSVQVTGRY